MPWWLAVILCVLAGAIGFFIGVLYIGRSMFRGM